jgi:hypothetical protein
MAASEDATFAFGTGLLAHPIPITATAIHRSRPNQD